MTTFITYPLFTPPSVLARQPEDPGKDYPILHTAQFRIHVNQYLMGLRESAGAAVECMVHWTGGIVPDSLCRLDMDWLQVQEFDPVTLVRFRRSIEWKMWMGETIFKSFGTGEEERPPLLAHEVARNMRNAARETEMDQKGRK